MLSLDDILLFGANCEQHSDDVCIIYWECAVQPVFFFFVTRSERFVIEMVETRENRSTLDVMARALFPGAF